MYFGHDRFFVCMISALLAMGVFSCGGRKELLDQPIYDGPSFEMDSVYTKISDSAKIIIILKSPKELHFENGDREWPQSMYLEYLDGEGNITSTFRADYVYYTAKDRIYRSEGNVVVINTENDDELNTEELFWDPRKKEFYTDRFVTIESEDEIHTGEGLTADQDFSSYTIWKPKGTLTIDE